MSLIVTFINNKPIMKRNVQDQILVDLAMVTIGYVILYSTALTGVNFTNILKVAF